MPKLKMSLESLEVTSFETNADARAERGTVLGQARTDLCTSPASPCLHSAQPGCVPITGPCTGPGCDVTLMISCVPCDSIDSPLCA